MKMNDKGFIAISIIYSFFILFIMVMLLIMYGYISDRKAVDRIKSDIASEFSSSAPKISINPTGDDEKHDSYIVTIKVTDKGNGISSIKYTWSNTQDGLPETDTTNNSVITSPTTSGKYYLIVKACDLDNNCQTLISNRFVVK